MYLALIIESMQYLYTAGPWYYTYPATNQMWCASFTCHYNSRTCAQHDWPLCSSTHWAPPAAAKSRTFMPRHVIILFILSWIEVLTLLWASRPNGGNTRAQEAHQSRYHGAGQHRCLVAMILINPERSIWYKKAHRCSSSFQFAHPNYTAFLHSHMLYCTSAWVVCNWLPLQHIQIQILKILSRFSTNASPLWRTYSISSV